MGNNESDIELLLCMRASSPLTVAGSSFNRRCSKCGQAVMIAPTGQAALKAKPKLAICCMVCYTGMADEADSVELAGPPEEVARELKNWMPNQWKKPN